MTSGLGQTADEHYGYTFTVRDETPGEHQARARLQASAAALIPGTTYRLVASFVDYDYKFNDEAESDVESDVPLPRQEAQRLVEPAVEAKARSRLAQMFPGDTAEAGVRPSLTALRVTRLLEVAPVVEPATGPTGAAVDDFGRRYAASRGLTCPVERDAGWRDPGPWFLASLNSTRSHALMVGGVAGGLAAEVWYAESARQRWDGPRKRWVVARYVLPEARGAGGIAVVVRRGRRFTRGGAPRGLTQMPRGLAEVQADDEQFARRYVVAAGAGNLVGVGSWVGRLFTSDFTAWLMRQPYGDQGAQATCFQLQGGVACVYAAGWPPTADSLDAFRERAARIASALESATRHVV